MTRKMLVAAGALTGPLGCSALAGDNWSGPYVGLIAGGAQGQTFVGSTVACPVSGFICDPVHYPQYATLIGATASGSKSAVVFAGGGSAGYNWRRDNFVYGVEGDVTALHLRLTDRGSGASLNLGLVNNPGAVPVIFTVNATAAINWLATFRARVGYLVSANFLMYATGGLALTSLSVSNSYTDNWNANGGGFENSGVTSTATGYVVGAGAEWSLARSWTVKAEYLHVGFGSLTTSGTIIPLQVPAAQNPFTSSANLAVDLFRAGLNYNF